MGKAVLSERDIREIEASIDMTKIEQEIDDALFSNDPN